MSRRVVRVTKTEFELDNGAVYPHPVPLDRVPSVDEFQATYDCWLGLFKDKGWINAPPVEEPEATKIKPKSRQHRSSRKSPRRMP